MKSSRLAMSLVVCLWSYGVFRYCVLRVFDLVYCYRHYSYNNYTIFVILVILYPFSIRYV
jgi:hypothetical protein